MAGTGEFAREAPYGPSHEPGVFVEPNQAQMPKPPAHWIGLKFYDPVRGLIGIGFVPPDHNDGLLSDAANEYVEARSSASGGDRPPLQLVVTEPREATASLP